MYSLIVNKRPLYGIGKEFESDMSKQIDQRLPVDSGKGAGFKEYAAIKSPWERLYGFRDAMHFSNRFEAVLGAAAMQAYRILVPDYAERSKIICESAYERIGAANRLSAEGTAATVNVHPFMCGGFTGALCGDQGDDALLMCGRVRDFGTYRAEKELDELRKKSDEKSVSDAKKLRRELDTKKAILRAGAESKLEAAATLVAERIVNG